MTPRESTLKGLLSGDLPMEHVGQRLRETARRAVLSGDPQRMARTAGLVVDELRRRGELSRVAVGQSGAPAPDLFFVRGSRRLVDLGALTNDAFSIETVAPVQPVVGPDLAPLDPADDVIGMLGAMEEAQNLEIGDPRSGETGVIVAGILRLLARFTPQFRLFALLHEIKDPPEDAPTVFAADADDPALGWLAVRSPGAAAWLPDVAGLPIGARRLLSDDQDFPAACAAAVPLFEPGENPGDSGDEVGLLFVAADESWLRDHLLRLAHRLAQFVTRRWRQQIEVNQRIHTDSLTGVFNRAYFDSQFTLELERARRSGIPLTLIIADIDHFKAVNDRYGHHVGDRVLVSVARRLQDELRRIDHVCRIGGEEFALILPDTSRDAAGDVMRRLLDGAFETVERSDEREVHIATTASYGAVTFPDAGVDAFELYRKADAMLYLSKDSGRHRCHFWNSSGDHTEQLPGAQATS
ncbi:MAG: GGDEF domain-containing protein [bacterium]|nr:GGDEF domain-containing protein [bacterium]